NGNTSQLIFTPEEQIEYASSILTLEPGDIFSCGTVAASARAPTASSKSAMSWRPRSRVWARGATPSPPNGRNRPQKLYRVKVCPQALLRTPPPSSLASSSDRAFAVVLALWSLLRLSLRRRILSGELRARFRPIGRRFDLGRTQRSCISPWLILRRRTQ